MSAKIYEAYRTPAGPGLWPLLWSIKRRGQAEAKARLAQVYRDILDGRAQAQADWYARAEWAAAGGITDPMERMRALLRRDFHPATVIGPKPMSAVAVHDAELAEANGREPGSRPTLLDVDHWVGRQYTAQLGSLERSKWNIDVTISVRVAGRWAYLIPHCDRASLVGGSLEFMAEVDGLTDFAYWNNTDRPDDVTACEWRKRRDAWHRLFPRWDECVLVEVVSWDSWRGDGSMLRDLAAEYSDRVM